VDAERPNASAASAMDSKQPIAGCSTPIGCLHAMLMRSANSYNSASVNFLSDT